MRQAFQTKLQSTKETRLEIQGQDFGSGGKFFPVSEKKTETVANESDEI